ncbi:autotransporter domain-containing protein [Flavobacterium sp. MXW15]|uniref:Autotransporter domain-containing protein n=1 Tax=Xanthomonas chitinilytica TaxID=2989819 RepID=A0ABT3K0G2_9XANT|nr:autotransporter domain-containing protein [Xanthomonas sp. H13-6]MCW4456515.1 autotransporter domain-containing protein [Flavobacterium sp. MXW15]MCW4474218.1 autotransporter domain-containing protein [Xanthomonas sp. H13-6]
MNRIYRLVFNRKLNVMQVASELACGHASGATGRPATFRPTVLGSAIAILLGIGVAPEAFAVDTVLEGNHVEEDTVVYNDDLIIGQNNDGSLVIRGNGNVTASSVDNRTSLGYNAGVTGRLSVEGADARLLITGLFAVGRGGNGELSVTDGAQARVDDAIRVGQLAGSSGKVLVSGVGSHLSSRWLDVGTNGTGELTIIDGGVVDVESASSANLPDVYIGHRGKGTLTIDGAGSALNVNSRGMSIGNNAQGDATLSNGASLTVARYLAVGVDSGGRGTLDVSGGSSVAAGSMTIGQGLSDGGTVVFRGASTGDIAGELTLSSSQEGELSIIEGSKVTAGSLVMDAFGGNIAREKTGKLVVDASRLDVTGLLSVTGKTSFINGATIDSGSAEVRDSGEKAIHALTIDGPATRWTNSGLLSVRSGMNITGGAVVTTDTARIWDSSNYFRLPEASGRIEALEVSGAGSRLVVLNGLQFSSSSTATRGGQLVVSAGGEVDTGAADIDAGPSSLLVIGAGWGTGEFAQAKSAGTLTGTGTIHLDDGAEVVFNHTEDGYRFDRTLASNGERLNEANGGIRNIAGTTVLGGDLGGFGGDIRVSGGKLILDSDTFTYGNTDRDGPNTSWEWQKVWVTGGELEINGKAGVLYADTGKQSSYTERSSLVAVATGGVLSGTGRSGSVEVLDGGIISPGGSQIGTYSIDGYLSINGTSNMSGYPRDVGTGYGKSFYDVDIAGDGRSDLLKVSGPVNIGSSVWKDETGVRVTALDPQTSYQDGKTYVIIDAAGGVNGTFTDVTTKSAFLTPTLSYTANTVVLGIAVASTNPGPNPDPDPDPGTNPNPNPNPGTDPDPGTANPPPVFGAAALTGNQVATAAALDTLVQSGEALALYNNLLMHSADEARLAFDALSGDSHPNTRALLLQDRFLPDAIDRTLRSGEGDDAAGGVTAWVSTGGGHATLDSDGNAAEARSSGFGAAAGVDWQLGEAWRLGAAIGYQDATLSTRARSAETDMDGRYAGVYFDGAFGNAYVRGGGVYADYDLDTRRAVYTANAPLQHVAGDTSATAVTFFAEAGLDVEFDGWRLSPYLNLAHTRLESDAFSEMGGSAALAVDAQKDEWWSATLGARATWEIADDAELSLGLGWQHAGGDETLYSRHRLLAGSNDFVVQGVPLARNVGLAEVGVVVNASERSRLRFGAHVRSGDGLSDIGGHVDWQFRF